MESNVLTQWFLVSWRGLGLTGPVDASWRSRGQLGCTPGRPNHRRRPRRAAFAARVEVSAGQGDDVVVCSADNSGHGPRSGVTSPAAAATAAAELGEIRPLLYTPECSDFKLFFIKVIWIGN